MHSKRWVGMLAGTAMALAMQMAKADVGVFGAPSQGDWNADVVSKITAAAGGRLGNVVDHRLCGYSALCEATPTLAQLQAYRSVLIYSDASFQDSEGLGNVLADYVDGGGRVVVATFSLNNEDSSAAMGRFESGGYLPVTRGDQTGFSGGTLVAVDADSPILQGVSTFNGGDSGYAAKVTLNPGAQLVASWNDADATPLIAVKGKVTAINFYPPSSDARVDFWTASTDGGKILANALYPGVLIAAVTLPEGQQGQAYPSTALGASGGTGPYTWTATGLPTGLTLSPTGVITGTPRQQGSFSVQVTVQDSSSPALTDTLTLALQIQAPAVAPTPTPVPTLGSLGLIALSVLMAGMGLVRRRKPSC